MSILPDPLTDTGENEAVGDKTPSQLATEALEPATCAFVTQEVGRHRNTCGARRQVRRWQLWAAGLIFSTVAAQGVLLLSWRAVIGETVRRVVREELDIRGLKAHAAIEPDHSWFIGSARAGEIQRKDAGL